MLQARKHATELGIELTKANRENENHKKSIISLQNYAKRMENKLKGAKSEFCNFCFPTILL